MIKKDLQKVIRELLSNNRTSLITEVSDETLDLQQKFFNDMLANKSKIVQRYGKDAEKVMKGKAMNLAKKETEKMEKQKLKELVRKTLTIDEVEENKVFAPGELDFSSYITDEQKMIAKAFMVDPSKTTFKDNTVIFTPPISVELNDGSTVMLRSVKMGNRFGFIKGYFDENGNEIEGYMIKMPSKNKMKEAKAEFSKEFDSNPALKGKQKELPDALQKAIIKKEKGVKEGMPEVKGLMVFGSTPLDNNAISDYLDDTDYYATWNSREGYWLFPEQEEYYDELETELTQDFNKLGIDARFEGIFSESLSEDIDLGHEDNEPHMIKGELYKIGKYAMELYQMVDQFEGQGEVDFPAWWQSKITKACSMIGSAKHYLEFELKEPEIDAMVGVAADEDILDENIGQDEMLAARLYKIKNFVQPAFFKKVRSLINSGDLETAELFISRMEPAAAKNDMEMAKMMGDLEDIDKVEAQRQREKQMANVFTEKKLTKAEKAKKEDIVKGMKKSFKGDESAMYAIATAKAKKVAETITKKLKETLYNPGEMHGEYEIGDIVSYNGEDHEVTRVEGDRIYIRPSESSAILGKKPAFWVKKDDLND